MNDNAEPNEKKRKRLELDDPNVAYPSIGYSENEIKEIENKHNEYGKNFHYKTDLIACEIMDPAVRGIQFDSQRELKQAFNITFPSEVDAQQFDTYLACWNGRSRMKDISLISHASRDYLIKVHVDGLEYEFVYTGNRCVPDGFMRFLWWRNEFNHKRTEYNIHGFWLHIANDGCGSSFIHTGENTGFRYSFPQSTEISVVEKLNDDP